jgi:hypothetical protein
MWRKKSNVGRTKLVAVAVCLSCVAAAIVRAEDPSQTASWAWITPSPESQGMNSTVLESPRANLKDIQTTAPLVTRQRDDSCLFCFR